MSDFLLNVSLYEHHNYPDGEDVSAVLHSPCKPILFQGKADCKCAEVIVKDDKKSLHTSYYVGVDRLPGTDHCIYIEPKLNRSAGRTNYLQMLVGAISHSEASNYTKDLFEIKFDEPAISIRREQDLLTPLLVVHFLKLVREIVRKGLKKSYYRIEENLYCKVKGKILVGKTLKQNVLKQKLLHTVCSHNEFGWNNPENRLLKKALLFVQRYLPSIKNRPLKGFSDEIINYINPAFDTVSDEISVHDIRHSKLNVFYREYEEAISLAKLILQRYAYNIANVSEEDVIKTPPFWIDMSKLFELYVFGLLSNRFKGQLKYHHTVAGNEIDFLLDSGKYKVVIDTKYKLKYITGIYHEDIRQVSGYARLESVYRHFSKPPHEIIDCLIIYPDQGNGNESFKDLDLLSINNKIPNYVGIYKISVRLPVL